MVWVAIPVFWTCASMAAGEASAPAAAKLPAVVLPPREFSLAPQPTYGPLRPILPAHRLALLEMRAPLAVNDPPVPWFARMLNRVTARYVENAGAVETETTRLCQELRARNLPAFPSEILEAALLWTRPAGSSPSVPLRFAEYAGRYRTLRIKEGKDHKAALSLLRPSAKAPARRP